MKRSMKAGLSILVVVAAVGAATYLHRSPGPRGGSDRAAGDALSEEGGPPPAPVGPGEATGEGRAGERRGADPLLSQDPARVSGRVVGSDGRPLGGLEAAFAFVPHHADREEPEGWQTAELGRMGEYEMGIPPGHPGMLHVWVPDFEEGTRWIQGIGAGETLNGVDFSLRRGAIVHGLVSDEQGRPVAGALVQAAGEDRTAGPGDWPCFPGKTPGRLGAWTDEYGIYEISGIPVGGSGRRMRILAVGLEFAPAVCEPFEVDPSTPRRVDIVLETAASLAVEAVHRNGSPLAAARLRIEFGFQNLSPGAPGNFAGEYTTDGQGRMPVIGPLPAGASYWFWAHHRPATPEGTPLRAMSLSPEAPLGPGRNAVIWGFKPYSRAEIDAIRRRDGARPAWQVIRLRGPRGEKLPEEALSRIMEWASLTVFDGMGEPGAAIEDHPDGFHFEARAGRVYTARLRIGNLELDRPGIRAGDPPEDIRLPLEDMERTCGRVEGRILRTCGRVEGRILGPGLDPHPRVTIEADDPHGGGSRPALSTRVATDGSFSADFVAPGTYRVRIHPGPLVSAPLEVTIGAAETVFVEIQAFRSGAVRGSGAPIPGPGRRGTDVFLVGLDAWGSPFERSVAPRPDGGFRIPDVPPGRYAIYGWEGSVAGLRALRAEAVVRGEDPVEVVLMDPPDTFPPVRLRCRTGSEKLRTLRLELTDGQGLTILRHVLYMRGEGSFALWLPGGGYDLDWSLSRVQGEGEPPTELPSGRRRLSVPPRGQESVLLGFTSGRGSE